jgi:hypothetical protein
MDTVGEGQASGTAEGGGCWMGLATTTQRRPPPINARRIVPALAATRNQ